MDIDQEYTRIKALFVGADEKQLALIDGEIMLKQCLTESLWTKQERILRNTLKHLH